MIDSQSLAEYSYQTIKASSDEELEQRLGLYRVFLKLYEHHRGLLDEILDLENTDGRGRTALRYVQGVVQSHQTHLITNLPKGKTQILCQPDLTWVIGRDRKAPISVRDKRLSRRHAVLQYVEGEGFYLVDLESTNGSFVNGEPVRYCTLLQDGDQLRLGSLAFTFFVGNRSTISDPLPSDVLDQINTIRRAIAPSSKDSTDSGYSTLPEDWDSSLPVTAGETSTFPVTSTPGGNLLSELAIPQISPNQQAEILDRFLKR